MNKKIPRQVNYKINKKQTSVNENTICNVSFYPKSKELFQIEFDGDKNRKKEDEKK